MQLAAIGGGGVLPEGALGGQERGGVELSRGIDCNELRVIESVLGFDAKLNTALLAVKRDIFEREIFQLSIPRP
ncbi:MAG: hypothetical protein JO091_03045 [Acidobacteriaceae bacterium]|nr:hypothetical protein [Acidobacteriaceae bacterium]MBV9611416.1 hypothetical protein [Acidobacteriaceae bacterium]